MQVSAEEANGNNEDDNMDNSAIAYTFKLRPLYAMSHQLAHGYHQHATADWTHSSGVSCGPPSAAIKSTFVPAGEAQDTPASQNRHQR